MLPAAYTLLAEASRRSGDPPGRFLWQRCNEGYGISASAGGWTNLGKLVDNDPRDVRIDRADARQSR